MIFYLTNLLQIHFYEYTRKKKLYSNIILKKYIYTDGK